MNDSSQPSARDSSQPSPFRFSIWECRYHHPSLLRLHIRDPRRRKSPTCPLTPSPLDHKTVKCCSDGRQSESFYPARWHWTLRLGNLHVKQLAPANLLSTFHFTSALQGGRVAIDNPFRVIVNVSTAAYPAPLHTYGPVISPISVALLNAPKKERSAFIRRYARRVLWRCLCP